METTIKRAKQPTLSETGEQALKQYEQRPCIEEDLAVTTIRNYFGDLCHFTSWCESIQQQGCEDSQLFAPKAVTSQRLPITEPTFKYNNSNRTALTAPSLASSATLLGSSPQDNLPMTRRRYKTRRRGSQLTTVS